MHGENLKLIFLLLNSAFFFLLASFLLFSQQELLVSASLLFWYQVNNLVFTYPLRKKNDTEERKENHGIKFLYFPSRKTSPFTCCSCVFFFHISLRRLYIPLLNIALQAEYFARRLPFIIVLCWP